MKKTIYVIAIFLIAVSCEKFDSGPAIQNSNINKRVLTGAETILKNNLVQAAVILSDIIQDDAVMEELAQISDDDRSFYSLTFRDLFDESKGTGNSFSNLRKRFLEECSMSGIKGEWDDLTGYLSDNDCYIYCPYPSSFYPKGTNSYTVAAHPIDNDIENKGYRYEGKKKVEVNVNEQYADKYQVLLIMPKDEGSGDINTLGKTGYEAPKGDPVYEVRIGKIRCADFCGGIFEGTLELRVTRGFPEYNLSTGQVKASFSTVIPIDYPRDYAKAAINNWTVHSNGGWYLSNNIWDSNWKPSKTTQCILAFEYDRENEISISATVGYKPENYNTSITATAKTTYSGDFLGIVEWDRDWFLATNSTPGPNDEIKDGWVVRKTCPVFKLTTPLRIIY